MSISLNKSVRTCTVNPGWSNRIQSDRFLTPANMVCIPWNGVDLTGRAVNENSWYTKTPGCNSATDRVYVENDLRPKYFEYITLDAAGVDGDFGTEAAYNSAYASNVEKNIALNNPNYGLQFQANIEPTCGINSYERAMAQIAQANRQAAYANSAYRSNQSRASCGNW